MSSQERSPQNAPSPVVLGASSNPYALDRTPGATRRAVLDVLAAVPCRGALGSRVIQYRLFGTDAVGATFTAQAIGWLHNARLIERAGAYKSARRRWRCTPAGRLALALDDLLEQVS